MVLLLRILDHGRHALHALSSTTISLTELKQSMSASMLAPSCTSASAHVAVTFANTLRHPITSQPSATRVAILCCAKKSSLVMGLDDDRVTRMAAERIVNLIVLVGVYGFVAGGC